MGGPPPCALSSLARPGRRYPDVDAVQRALSWPATLGSLARAFVEQDEDLAFEHRSEVPLHNGDLVRHAGSRGQLPTEGVERRRQLLALACLLRLFPNAAGQLTHAQRYGQHDGEREKEGRLANAEGRIRGHETEV